MMFDYESEKPHAASAEAWVVRLCEPARSMASDGRVDDDAVEALRTAASGRVDDLWNAAIYVHFDGTISESRTDHLADRMLRAAAGNTPLVPLAPELDEWFRRVESIDHVTPAEAFDRLAALVPQLRDLEGAIALALRLPARPTDAEEDSAWDVLEAHLEQLVGPEASSEDELVRTLTAYGMCRLHLAQIVGLKVDY